VVVPDLIGCLLVKRQASGELLWGVIVETEAYCQSEPACSGHRRRSSSNDTLFGELGRFYVYESYSIHNCRAVMPVLMKRRSSRPSGSGRGCGGGIRGQGRSAVRGDRLLAWGRGSLQWALK
jgi:DNA-3-methyladenine glycosylase